LIELIENIDRELLFAINANHSAFLDQLMWIISEEYFGIPFYLLFLFLAFKIYGWKGAIIFTVGAAMTIGLTDLMAKHLFKEVFLRYRPSNNLEIRDQLHFVNNYRGGTYGFVSSHAANMFAITTVSFLLLLRNKSNWWWLIFLFPIIISYSRVYLGVHYPTDVFCGGLLGIFIGWIFYRILVKQMNPLKHKL
jgi:undecaprenyl-diphosphatase